MKRLADRFAAAVSRCCSLEDLRLQLDGACSELGFTYFALLHHAALGHSRASLIRLHNYPQGWVNQLEAEAGLIDDPVHCACRRTSTGFAWQGLAELGTIAPSAKQRFIASRDHGLGEGFTIPVHVPGEPAGSCSFAAAGDAPLPYERLQSAELVGRLAFEMARSLSGTGANPDRPYLSPRERQCLKLVACGKTDWEVSVILGISVETARQYLKQARQSYDVVSRTQLVVLGLRDDWLSFDDALPALVPPVAGSSST
ncbi:LuxR family transcriptional regulator [Sphingomonas sabuli]|uniref:LuxR family transcriptional regulator n=1 Tax=Sphingomonas sabuli TaxID=2764186 RepID=A0A7G9L3Z2_9SPHN|nr:LuxR family transcriptional regulator [Sphingomonas sabuli]QNM83341.1 LuxR family transcriptional regulator [Sphingomonas sabuli]